MELGDICTREAHEKGAEINITHPVTGKPTDIFITVLGRDSKAWRKAKKTAYAEVLSGKSVDEKLDEDDLERLEIIGLSYVTTGWRGIQKDGKSLDFSIKDCQFLYEQAPHTREQIDKYIGDRANFTKG